MPTSDRWRKRWHSRCHSWRYSACHSSLKTEVAMYKTKPCFRCRMPSETPLNVLALNASLKHEPTLSNTGELASLVLDEMHALAQIHGDVIRLSDEMLPVGLGFREAANDDWPNLVSRIKAA